MIEGRGTEPVQNARTSMTTPAKLPEELARSHPRRMSDMEVGQIFRVEASEMMVDDEGNCYLNAEALISTVTLPIVTIVVHRLDDGFHVVVDPNCRWEKRLLNPDSTVKLIPVASLEIRGEEMSIR
jgi:hypothetical protein